MVQPADVSINRVFKHKVKQSALDFFTSYVTRKFGEGIPLEKILIPMDLPTLQDVSVAWTLDAWLYFCRNPNIICRTWENCKVDDFNFSWESLHSLEATQNLEDLLANDEIFCTVRTRKGAQSCVTAWYVQLVPYVTRHKLGKTIYI